MGAPEPEFHVLTVCYANLCRSPLMEAMTRQYAAARGLAWQVSSAGIAARDGEPMHRHSRRILAQRGIEPADWTSRSIDGDLVMRADLVLTATEPLRDQLLATHSSARSHTFALMPFAALVTSQQRRDAASFGPWLLDEARRNRGVRQPLPPERRDLADPMGRSARWFRSCERAIDEALTAIFAPLPEVTR